MEASTKKAKAKSPKTGICALLKAIKAWAKGKIPAKRPQKGIVPAKKEETGAKKGAMTATND